MTILTIFAFIVLAGSGSYCTYQLAKWALGE